MIKSIIKSIVVRAISAEHRRYVSIMKDRFEFEMIVREEIRLIKQGIRSPLK